MCCVPVSFSVELLDPALKSRFQEQQKGRETFGLEPRRSRPAPARLLGRAGLSARSPAEGGAGRGSGGAGPASKPLIGPCCRRPVLLSPRPLFPADSWGCSDLLAPLRPQPARVRRCSFFALSSSHPTRELPSAQPFSPFLVLSPPCTISSVPAFTTCILFAFGFSLPIFYIPLYRYLIPVIYPVLLPQPCKKVEFHGSRTKLAA